MMECVFATYHSSLPASYYKDKKEIRNSEHHIQLTRKTKEGRYWRASTQQPRENRASPLKWSRASRMPVYTAICAFMLNFSRLPTRQKNWSWWCKASEPAEVTAFPGGNGRSDAPGLFLSTSTSATSPTSSPIFRVHTTWATSSWTLADYRFTVGSPAFGGGEAVLFPAAGAAPERPPATASPIWAIGIRGFDGDLLVV